jgi:mannose-6-phosphate isomerase-like protein (cupin superfamily)
MEVGPGDGTLPHYHRSYDEHFEVIEGTLEVLVGEEIRTLNSGEKAVARRIRW